MVSIVTDPLVVSVVLQGVKSVKEELDETAFRGKLYKAPGNVYVQVETSSFLQW